MTAEELKGEIFEQTVGRLKMIPMSEICGEIRSTAKWYTSIDNGDEFYSFFVYTCSDSERGYKVCYVVNDAIYIDPEPISWEGLADRYGERSVPGRLYEFNGSTNESVFAKLSEDFAKKDGYFDICPWW